MDRIQLTWLLLAYWDAYKRGDCDLAHRIRDRIRWVTDWARWAGLDEEEQKKALEEWVDRWGLEALRVVDPLEWDRRRQAHR